MCPWNVGPSVLQKLDGLRCLSDHILDKFCYLSWYPEVDFKKEKEGLHQAYLHLWSLPSRSIALLSQLLACHFASHAELYCRVSLRVAFAFAGKAILWTVKCSSVYGSAIQTCPKSRIIMYNLQPDVKGQQQLTFNCSRRLKTWSLSTREKASSTKIPRDTSHLSLKGLVTEIQFFPGGKCGLCGSVAANLLLASNPYQSIHNRQWCPLRHTKSGHLWSFAEADLAPSCQPSESEPAGS